MVQLLNEKFDPFEGMLNYPIKPFNRSLNGGQKGHFTMSCAIFVSVRVDSLLYNNNSPFYQWKIGIHTDINGQKIFTPS